MYNVKTGKYCLDLYVYEKIFVKPVRIRYSLTNLLLKGD
jgi:hypothetical protein